MCVMWPNVLVNFALLMEVLVLIVYQVRWGLQKASFPPPSVVVVVQEVCVWKGVEFLYGEWIEWEKKKDQLAILCPSLFSCDIQGWPLWTKKKTSSPSNLLDKTQKQRNVFTTIFFSTPWFGNPHSSASLQGKELKHDFSYNVLPFIVIFCEYTVVNEYKLGVCGVVCLCVCVCVCVYLVLKKLQNPLFKIIQLHPSCIYIYKIDKQLN